MGYGAWIMFPMHIPWKFSLKCFPSDSAKQCKLWLAEYAVKNSHSSEQPNCWCSWNRTRFILANLQTIIGFDPGIMRHLCVCLGTDRTGELRRKCRVEKNRIYCVNVWQNERLMESAVVQLQRHRGEGLCTVKWRQAKLCCNLYYKQNQS